MKTDWIIIRAESDPRGVCLRCGSEFGFNMPISFRKFIKGGQAFVKIHKRCKEKKDQ